MELNQRSLRYLVTVVDEGHFGRAAASLHVSAPALSKQIRKLEADVGLVLLDRDTHPVRPTPDGAEFLAAAREVLASADHAVAVAAAARRRRSGVLTIGFVLGFAGHLTRPILDGVAAADPDITVELQELGFADQTDAVLRSTVDASFARAPLRRDPGLHFELVMTEPRVLLVAARHRLAGRSGIGIAEIAGERQIRLADDVVDAEWARWWAADPRPDGTAPNYLASIHTFGEFLEFIAGGRAVGITTPSLGEQFSRSDIAFVPIDDIDPSELYLCTRTARRAPAVDVLREVTRAQSRFAVRNARE